jgi:hypothetical protein
MRPVIRTLAAALTFASLGIGASYAQTPAGGAGANPASRGAHDSFFYGPLNGQPSAQVLGNDMIKRPKGNATVSPVPEPSQWAMMLAGLALVSFIVKRRNGAR